MADWTRARHIPNDSHFNHGLVYECQHGHEWFVSFEDRRKLETVNCPKCEKDAKQSESA